VPTLERRGGTREHKRMFRSHPLFWLTLLLLTSATCVAHAQPVALVCDAPPDLIDQAALRVAIEGELSMPVLPATAATGPGLRIHAAALNAVDVSFTRPGHPSVGRTVDVSAQGARVIDTLALLAANLVRDEAAELLPGLPPPPPPAAPLCQDFGLRRLPVGVDLVPRLGTSSYGEFLRAERAFSFNLIGGLSGAVRGAEFGGVFNLDVHGLCGAQFAGTLNYVGGPVTGAQFGLVNFALGPLTGAQFGLVDMDIGDMQGAQFGLTNLATGDAEGAQFGLTNLILRTQQGLQAGLVNFAGRGLRGAQLGLANIVSAETKGAQLGLVNFTRGKMNGAMIGLVNIAEDADAPIGLIDIIWHGRTQIDAWATDAGVLMAGVEHGSRYVHNIYGIGIKPMSNSPAFAISFGLGIRALAGGRFTLDIDAMEYGLLHHSSWAQIAQLRIPLAITLISGAAVFIAPEVNFAVADAGSDLIDPALYKTTRVTQRDAGTSVRFWPGLSLGLRFL
jgi:hypothetical protein